MWYCTKCREKIYRLNEEEFYCDCQTTGQHDFNPKLWVEDRAFDNAII